MASLDLSTLSPTNNMLNDEEDEIALPISYRPTRSKRTISVRCCLVGAGVSSILLGVLVVILDFTGNLRAPISTTAATSAYSEQHWPPLQQALCPDGVPDPSSWGPTLFELARSQLGFTPEDFAAAKRHQHVFTKPHPDRELTFRFFHGQYQDAVVYTANKSSDDTTANKTVAYIPIWNDANIAVHQWMQDTLNSSGVVDEVATEDLFAVGGKDKRLQSLCVVTTVRDPIQHFLSAYNEVEYRRHNVEENSILPTYYELPHTNAEQRNARFAQFVSDLVLEDSKGFHGGLFSHIFSMSRILTELNRVGGQLTAYLPSLANLNSKFPQLVQSTCGLKETLPPIPKDKGHHKSSEDLEGFYQAAKDVWTDKGAIARALCALHAMDYACWTDLPDGIPQVCQEVYSSSDFVNAFIG
jgi:hypothetical protein